MRLWSPVSHTLIITTEWSTISIKYTTIMVLLRLFSRKEQPAALVITTSTPIIILCTPDLQRLSVRRQHTDVTLYDTSYYRKCS